MEDQRLIPEARRQPSERERRSRPHDGEDLVLPGTWFVLDPVVPDSNTIMSNNKN